MSSATNLHDAVSILLLLGELRACVRRPQTRLRVDALSGDLGDARHSLHLVPARRHHAAVEDPGDFAGLHGKIPASVSLLPSRPASGLPLPPHGLGPLRHPCQHLIPRCR
jgi:hypothetical protein